MNEPGPLLAIFGVLSDIQYADFDDLIISHGSARYYRNSLNLVNSAIDYWKLVEKTTNLNLNFILHLGDLVDSRARLLKNSDVALDRVLSVLNQNLNSNQPATLLHIWGNHEFYNFKRSDLVNSQLNTSRLLNQNFDSNSNYYSVQITDNLKIICLDQFELSILGYKHNHPNFIRANNFLTNFNKNTSLNSSNGLPDHLTHLTGFNGAMGEHQIQWLDQELSTCKNKNIKAIVCGHIPVHRKASINRVIAWDADMTLGILHKYEETVLCFFAGHYHPGGYYKDNCNIHHLTFKAVLETSKESNSYATVYVYSDRVCLRGTGDIPSFEVKIR